MQRLTVSCYTTRDGDWEPKSRLKVSETAWVPLRRETELPEWIRLKGPSSPVFWPKPDAAKEGKRNNWESCEIWGTLMKVSASQRWSYALKCEGKYPFQCSFCCLIVITLDCLIICTNCSNCNEWGRPSWRNKIFAGQAEKPSLYAERLWLPANCLTTVLQVSQPTMCFLQPDLRHPNSFLVLWKHPILSLSNQVLLYIMVVPNKVAGISKEKGSHCHSYSGVRN